MSKILLSTLNSTYQHTSFGLRYLKANLKELESFCEIREFTISQKPEDIVEKILSENPVILGFGVYIWNTQPTFEVINLIKKIAPEIIIVLGGPEVSFETEDQPIVQISDFVIKGEADFQFYELCSQLLAEVKPEQKIWKAVLPAIDQVKTPYHLFSENDLSTRILYVEASRGCPYKCEYCLSSLDVSVRNFPLEPFLKDLESLIQKGARTFKFVDRTFNLSPKISTQILQFFLNHSDKQLFLHFEMVPDRLPIELKSLIEQFPAGTLQFEIGIQTWNPKVAAHVSRRQDYNKIIENLNYLKEKTKVHSHVDLIVGLPGENLECFANGFNQLVSHNPDEIQVGILKRLKGAPISRHDQEFEMLYATHSPFQILKTKDISYFEIQKMNRFAKYWDQIANSGHFKTFISELKMKCANQNSSFFHVFLSLTDFLYEKHGQAHAISLLSLTESLWNFLTNHEKWSHQDAANILIHDYSIRGRRDIPNFLKDFSPITKKIIPPSKTSVTPKRQQRHLEH